MEFGIWNLEFEICLMFTGIVETQGVVKKVIENGTNKTFWIKSPVSPKLKPDQSVSHDGVCLTVETVKNSRHKVTAIEETLNKTTLGNWQTGQIVNLERCLKINSRLDGHIVQGHVDVTGICTATIEKAGSWEFRFEFPVEFAELIIEKGSITVNGISLTAYDVTNNSFSVAIIPYTFEHTNINMTKPDKLVNLEFDIIGKYISRKNKLTL